jgi:Rieske Fe-S protein
MISDSERPCASPPISESPSDASRRSFFQLLAAGAGVALLHGCGTSDTTSPNVPAAGSTANPIAAVASGNEFVISGGGTLKKGQALAFRLPNQEPGIVFVTDNGKLHALSAKCTHMGCVVEWQRERSDIRCPCHGSVFDAAGNVLSGPATKPLGTFKVRKQGNDALISLG